MTAPLRQPARPPMPAPGDNTPDPLGPSMTSVLTVLFAAASLAGQRGEDGGTASCDSTARLAWDDAAAMLDSMPGHVIDGLDEFRSILAGP